MGRSQSKPTTGYLWTEEGERHEATLAEVATVLPVSRTYTFAVPPGMEADLGIGRRVTVPIGRKGRLVRGFVVGLDRGVWDSTLRWVDSMLDSASFLTPDLIRLGREMAIHYVCPLGRTLKAMTPDAVRRKAGFRTIRFARLGRPIEDLLESTGRIGLKQRAILETLAARSDPMVVPELLDRAGASAATLRGLVRKGWVGIAEEKIAATDVHDNVGTGANENRTARAEPTFELNTEQRVALESIGRKIDERRFSATLLYGVSGSGKTEVYIRAIRQVVATGRQAIFLVPEIVLTTQLAGRLASRFSNVALMHSGLTDAQRSVMWDQIARGERKVVIGTRSAVFSPCPQLGLIVVDEEQEASFKNLQAPRFHVRDVALMRGQQLGIPVVMGSATPSIEVWHRSAHHPDYQRVTLRRRVKNLPMPKVVIVDMWNEKAELGKTVAVSRTMERLLGETLDRSEQALILMNRRGSANRICCPACKSRIECPNCNVNLVVHTATGQSICHYCQRRIPTPTVCPNVTCGQRLVQLGLGTQRVTEVLSMLFPKARIQRVDSDTMTHREKYQWIVSAFEAREIDILVGTQMIAKGLDFPFVSFVGVVNADPTALSSDFRAHERLFQLITQVAGRAGRADAPGRVVVQTTMPELEGLKYALEHDYESFAAAELDIRHRVGMPPFRRLARCVLADARERRARQEAEALAQRIRGAMESASLTQADVLGPHPCALSRIRGRYRFDLLVRTANARSLRELLGTLDESGSLRTKAESTIIDVDPVALT